MKSFLGLAGYYLRFVQGYGSIAKPLTELLKRGSFKWDEETEGAFLKLKEALVSAPILALPDLSKSFTVEMDAFQLGIGAAHARQTPDHLYQ